MKSRAFAHLRYAAVTACLGSALGLALPAQAAESGAVRTWPAKINLNLGSAQQAKPVSRAGFGAGLPAGAGAYVRPFQGFLLPRVWVVPTYYISNWQGFGLPRPAQGFGWSRYYDDAVLTDRNGRVYDSVQGVNWAAAQAGPVAQAGQAAAKQTYSPDYDPYNYDSDLLLGNDQVVHGTHWARTANDPAPDMAYNEAAYDYADAPTAPPPPLPAPPAQYSRANDDAAFLEACRRDNGVGGAAIGAGLGGLAGNRIAGRGNRTGGMLIGAGVGAVTGMVIDKAEDRERCKRLLASETRGGYGTSYAPPPVAAPAPYYNTAQTPPPVAAPAPYHASSQTPPPAPYYADPQTPPPAYAADYDPAFLAACRRDSGLGGAAIGAGVGGLAGNRIAGRGNRTGGTLIGAGVGAIAGLVIDKAEDRERCKRMLAQYEASYQGGGNYAAGYPPPPGQPNGYPPPPPGYYYYYPPPIITTVTITPGE